MSPDRSLWVHVSDNIDDIKNFRCDSPAEILIDNIAKTHFSKIMKKHRL